MNRQAWKYYGLMLGVDVKWWWPDWYRRKRLLKVLYDAAAPYVDKKTRDNLK